MSEANVSPYGLNPIPYPCPTITAPSDPFDRFSQCVEK